MDSLLLLMTPKRDPVPPFESEECKLASETGLCNRLREGGGSGIGIETEELALLELTAKTRGTGKPSHCITVTMYLPPEPESSC